MNFDFTESRIEWEHNNENKVYYVDNIEFASYEKKLIYIEICNDSGYEYRYIDLNGTDIVWYTENGMLSIFGIKKKTIKLEQIEDVMIIGDNIFVMFSDKEEKKISEFAKIDLRFIYYTLKVNGKQETGRNSICNFKEI